MIEPAVTRLFKIIVKKSAFVSKWKVQRVTPVHKRGSKADPKKYRPVSVVEIFLQCLKILSSRSSLHGLKNSFQTGSSDSSLVLEQMIME